MGQRIAIDRITKEQQERLGDLLMSWIEDGLIEIDEDSQLHIELELKDQQFIAKLRNHIGTSKRQEAWQRGIAAILDVLKQMGQEFDDMEQRLALHVSLIHKFVEQIKLARAFDHRYLESATITLHDAIRSVYSEDWTLEQIDTIQACITRFENTRWELEDVLSLDDSLASAGFETVPSDRFVSFNGE
jgi:hypothetical protein